MCSAVDGVLEPFGECLEGGTAVTRVRGTVHLGDRGDVELGEPADRGRGTRRERPRRVVLGQRGSDDVLGGQRRVGAPSNEEIAADQGSCGLVVEQPGLPCMRDVGRVDRTQRVPADVRVLAVGQASGWTIGDITDADTGDGVMDRGAQHLREPPAANQRPPPAGSRGSCSPPCATTPGNRSGARHAERSRWCPHGRHG